MDGWNKLQAGIASMNLGASANSFAKGVSSSMQLAKERLGAVSAEEITELPQEYKDLEARVDALRATHVSLLKIARVYETEAYDYPTQVQESLVEMGNSVGHSITSFAATNLKGTNLPVPTVGPASALPPKTLPHALARAAASGAGAVGRDAKLGRALGAYAGAAEKVGAARLAQDAAIRERFLAPWNTTLASSIAVALKARAAVKASRVELDAAKQSLKAASAGRQEQARLEVENAEDDLVQKTEVAIKLMKTVLENPEPLKDLHELVKAQLAFHAAAAEALQAVQGDVEELAVAAEGEYRKSRDH